MPETSAARFEASSRDTPGPMRGAAGAGPPQASDAASEVASGAASDAILIRRSEVTIPDAIAAPLGQARRGLYISAMSFIVELLHQDAQAPRRATEGSAGYDLHAYLRGRAIR